MAAPTIRCPHCGKAAEYSPENAFRPFCSKRCKMTDLGAWAEERYSIAGKPSTADLDETEHSDDESDRTGPNTRLDS